MSESPSTGIAKFALAAAVATSAAMTLAAHFTDQRLMTLAATAFAIVMIAEALRARIGSPPGGDLAGLTAGERISTNRTAALIGLGYGWGAVTMLAIYLTTPVWWRHGWQYGSAMALIALAHAYYLKQLGDDGARAAQPSGLRWAAGLAGLQALAASVALAWLIGSGKLDTVKGDWAANDVFLGGGIAIIAASVVAVLNRLKFARARAAARR